MRSSDKADQIGSKLGPRLVHLISQTIMATKLKLLDTEHRTRVNSMQEIIDRAGREIADLYRPVLRSVTQDLELPDEVRDFIEKSVSGTHQWHAIAGLGLQASGATSSLSTIMNNFLAPGVRFAVQKDPQLSPVPETLVQLAAKGTMPKSVAYDWSHGAGYSDFQLDAMVEANKSYPDFETTVELLRRKLITQAEAELYFERNAIPQSVWGHILALQHQPLSPADAADMVIRGIKSQEEGRAIAAEAGVSATDFDALVLDTGEPVALMQLLEARRRGFIDEARLKRGILQSRIRNEWIDVAEKLAYSPMSVADAVNAVVQNHLTQAEGEAFAQQNGLEPGQFGILIETAGEPLSRTEMEQLFNRGLVTQAQVDQALRESRVKDKYVDLAFKLHEHVPPIFTVQRALRFGGISHEEAIRIVMESGYNKTDAEWIVAAGSAERTQTHRNQVVAAIEGLYEDNAISSADALKAIRGQGFETAEADLVVTAAEFKRQAKITTQVMGAIRSRYLNHRITQNTASGLLDGLGLPTTQRDTLLALWDVERSAYTRTLTEAQIVKAVKKQLITSDDGLARLVAMGYSNDDAALLLEEI